MKILVLVGGTLFFLLNGCKEEEKHFFNYAPAAENRSFTTTEDTAISGTLVVSDADSNGLAFTIVSNGSKGTASVTNLNSGTFAYTPHIDASGVDTFTFKANDGYVDSNTATITVTITPVNDAPLAHNGTFITNEDVAKSGILSANDVDNSSLTYSIVSNGNKGAAAITNASNGAFIYTPNANANGSDTFTFRASDGALNSNTATITVTITPVNDAPIAINQSIVTNETTAKAITLTASDADSDTITYKVLSQPNHGGLSGTPPNVIYSPDSCYSGYDWFTFYAQDTEGDSSNEAKVSIYVGPKGKVANCGAFFGHRFGYSVALNGNFAIIGDPTHKASMEVPGAAYVYQFDGLNWVEKQQLKLPYWDFFGKFGSSVALSDNVAVVGAPGEYFTTGDAYVYRFNGTEWIKEQDLQSSGQAVYDLFGHSVSISGNRVLVGAPLARRAHLFQLEDGTWNEKYVFKSASSKGSFGSSVSISGDNVLIGDSQDGGPAYAYNFNGTGWEETLLLNLMPGCGPVTVYGSTAAVGCPFYKSRAGSVFIFQFDEGRWLLQQQISPSDGQDDDQFGKSVSLFRNKLVVGNKPTSFLGSTYYYTYNGNSWVETKKLKPTDQSAGDNFGYSVSVSDDYFLGGAYGAQVGSERRGAAYFIKISGTH